MPARWFGRARHHEQQIGQAVDVAQQHGIDRRLERDHPALGAPAHRPRHVQRGAAGTAAGQDESPERRHLGFETIDELLEARDVGVAEGRLGDAGGELVGGIGELGAEREQVALDAGERLVGIGIDARRRARSRARRSARRLRRTRRRARRLS